MAAPDYYAQPPAGSGPPAERQADPGVPAAPDPAEPADDAAPTQGAAETHDGADRTLPGPVRQRVIALVSGVLPDVPPEELPGALRRIARFAPQRRAKLGGAAIATQPAADDAVAEQIRKAEQRAERHGAELAAARAETDRLREQAASLAAEASNLREQVRQLTKTLREAEEQQRRTAQLLATEKGRAQRAAADHDAEVRRLRAKLAEAEAVVEGSRQAEREGRAIDDARVWLLLETIGQAAQGLRRELAMEPADRLPADFVAATAAEPLAEPGRGARALDTDDPARLDQLLALPKAHLVIDGYNVTKRGYGDLSLEQQRKRLVSGLGGIAAQTGAEVTVVFDGAERVVGLPPAPRGVRVLFSKKGETADELIRRLVRAEPAGRPVVVVSSDREVADGVRRHGAYPLGADSLLRRLSRS